MNLATEKEIEIILDRKLFSKEAVESGEVESLEEDCNFWINRSWDQFSKSNYYKSLKNKERVNYKEVLLKAFVFAAYNHVNKYKCPQKRDCGNNFVDHPFRQAFSATREVDELKRVFPFVDVKSHFITIIFHDLLEDGQITKDQICTEFGCDIAEMVDIVTKDSTVTNPHKKIYENLHKFFTKASENVRGLFVKMYDVRDNSRTLNYVNEDKPGRKIKILLEALEFYVPFAEILGAMGFKHIREIKKIFLRDCKKALEQNFEPEDFLSLEEYNDYVYSREDLSLKYEKKHSIYELDRSIETKKPEEYLEKLLTKISKLDNLEDMEKALFDTIKKARVQKEKDVWLEVRENEHSIARKVFKQFLLKSDIESGKYWEGSVSIFEE